MSRQIYLGEAAVPHYESNSLPLRIKDIKESKKGTIVFPHWHEDIELMYVKSGVYEYRINDDSLIMQAGDFVFVNAKVMHYIRVLDGDAPQNYCVIFKPSILTGNTEIFQKFLEPISTDNPLEYLYFPRNTKASEECGKWMEFIIRGYEEDHNTYELAANAGLNMIIRTIYKEFSLRIPSVKQNSQIGEEEKKMISFIYDHYQNDISLDDISASAYVSNHTCCAIFKRYVGVSPVKFLNMFRLEMAGRMLISSEQSVQDIAWACGFKTSAYFIKMFKDQYGCTPFQYRKMNK